jgi:hypothetical protein
MSEFVMATALWPEEGLQLGHALFVGEDVQHNSEVRG